MNDVILWEIKDNIGHVIFNRPPNNKMDMFFFKRLTYLVNNDIPASKVDAIIIYGNGRHFSQGADINDLLINISKYPDFLKSNVKSFAFFNNLKIPVIAAIKGVCIGSAFELSLFCNIRICSPNSVFGFPESTFNLMPGCGGTQNILKFIKKSKAIELLLKGTTLNAEECLGMNIIDKIVPRQEVIETAISIAKHIRKNIKNDKLEGVK